MSSDIELQQNGRTPRWSNRVEWARYELVQLGYMDNPGRGVWRITQKARDWLAANPDAVHLDESPVQRKRPQKPKRSQQTKSPTTKPAEISKEQVDFRLAGSQFSLSAAEVFAVVRNAIQQGLPVDAHDYRTWYIDIDGAQLNVKWIVELVTGMSRNQYNSVMARKILLHLGLAAKRVNQDSVATSATPVTFSPAAADQREPFSARLIDYVQEYLRRAGVNHVELNARQRRNYVQLRADAFPGSHYEVALHRTDYEIGLHFESSKDQSLRRLAAFRLQVGHLTESYGETVQAEVWRENWGRVFVEHPLEELEWDDIDHLGWRVGRFIDLTYPILCDAYMGGPGSRPPSVTPAHETYALLDAELDAIRQFLLGRGARPSNERLCDWVHFCYTLALYSEAADLFRLIDPAQVNSWYYERTKRLAKICALRHWSEIKDFQE